MNICIWDHFQVDELEPIAQGGPTKDVAWHSDLPKDCTLVDALERAGEPNNLYALRGFSQKAQELHHRYTEAKVVHSVYGVNLPAVLASRSDMTCTHLARTHAEALLARLFAPDQMAKLDAEERDESVRAIQREMAKYAKWSTVFAPLRTRAKMAKQLQ